VGREAFEAYRLTKLRAEPVALGEERLVFVAEFGNQAEKA
jgi:hypothetical protein